MRVVADRGGRADDLLVQRQLAGALSDDLGIEAVKTSAVLEGLLHARHGMIAQ